jgi:hypothetical protein
MAAEPTKKPLAVLALGIGKPVKKGEGGDEEESYSDDFESAAADAFPELKDDPDRMAAFRQAVMSCVDNAKGAKGDES